MHRLAPRPIFTACASIVVLSAAAAQGSTELAVNGEFEQPSIAPQPWNFVYSVPGWSSASGAFEFWSGTGYFGSAPGFGSDGQPVGQHAELIAAGGTTNTFTQTFVVPAGQTRGALSFDAWKRIWNNVNPSAGTYGLVGSVSGVIVPPAAVAMVANAWTRNAVADLTIVPGEILTLTITGTGNDADTMHIDQVSFLASTPCDGSADIDGNSVVNGADAAAFALALLGGNANAQQVARSDINCDGAVDGRDVQAWVNATLN